MAVIYLWGPGATLQNENDFSLSAESEHVSALLASVVPGPLLLSGNAHDLAQSSPSSFFQMLTLFCLRPTRYLHPEAAIKMSFRLSSVISMLHSCYFRIKNKQIEN